MDTTGRSLTELIEHGRAAIRRSELDTREAAAGARPIVHRLPPQPSTIGTEPPIVNLAIAAPGTTTSVTTTIEDLAVHLLVLSRTCTGDPAELRLRLLKAIEMFILAISPKQ